MQRLIYLPLLFLLIVAVSCNEYSTSEVEVETIEFTKEITDSVIMEIDSFGSPILIKGDLKLIEGECVLSLKAPKGNNFFNVDTTFVNDTIFSIDTVPLYDFIYKKSFKAPATVKLDETFDRVPGQWTFYYEVKKLEDVQPEGSFDFVMKYLD